jgi:bifunctional UDP-N-acetylglucosamine pyrophosphorylase / glucosamine-1-phosphate N-acetyltransferase
MTTPESSSVPSSVSVSILAAGLGKRMHSEMPKVLHHIAGRPLVGYVLDVATALADPAGGALALVVGHGHQQVQRALGDSWTYVRQTELLGTGHALLQCHAALAGKAASILVLYGDTPLIRVETLRRMLEHHRVTGAAATVLTFFPADPHGYGRIVRDAQDRVLGIVEERVATDEQRLIREANSGILCFQDDWVWSALRKLGVSEAGEYFLTDLPAMAVAQGRRVEGLTIDDPSEVMGINDRAQLAEASQVMRERINRRVMLSGVTLVDPAATYLDDTVTIEPDTIIEPNTHIRGQTHIGWRCTIGPNTVLEDCRIGNDCRLEAVFAEGATLENGVGVGPYAHLRSGAHLADGVHMGNFGEIKKSYLGPGTKMGHFSYIGDAQIGADVNIGAGTITCNFDGKRKHKTVIGDHVFIGSDTMLVAPVEIGPDAKTGAGSVVTHDVPAGSLAYGVPARVRGRTVETDDEDKAPPASE